MFKSFRSFRDHQDGAVTVDWVVLAGALTVITLTMIKVLSNTAVDPETGLGAQLNNREIIENRSMVVPRP